MQVLIGSNLFGEAIVGSVSGCFETNLVRCFGSSTILVLKILVHLFGEVFPLCLFVIIWNSPKGDFVRPLVSRL